jgi:hypothetical protein
MMFYLMLLPTLATAFVGPSSFQARPSTKVFLEDRIAHMIDNELYRETHVKEFEAEWMAKNKGTMMYHMHDDSLTNYMPELLDGKELRAKAKDRQLAQDDPFRYCADRCVATGNCDAFEDIYDLTAFEVLEFCENCVLSDGEDPCMLPDSFFEYSQHPTGLSA